MLEIDVVSEPAAAVKLERHFWDIDLRSITRYDERLVKPAILIADRVNLITFREDMMMLVRSDAFENSRMPMRFIYRYAGLSFRRDPVELEVLGLSEKVLASEEDTANFLNPPEPIGNPADLKAGPQLPLTAWKVIEAFEKKHNDQIREYRSAYAAVLRDRRDALVSESLTLATDRGILTASAWHSQPPSDYELTWTDIFENYLPEAVERLVARLGSPSRLALLEPGAQMTLSGLVGGSIVEATPPRVAELQYSAAVAATLAAQIPSLHNLSLKEILEVRDDLHEYLPAFRAAMLELTEEISAEADASPVTLAKEVERRWERDVSPALQEIRHHVRRSRYSRNVLSAFAEDKSTLVSSASSIVLAVGSVFAGVGALIPAAAAAAYPFIRALNETLRSRDEARKNQLYFLYGVQHRVRSID